MMEINNCCFVCSNSGYSTKHKEIWCRCRQISLSVNASLNMICQDGYFERLDKYFEDVRTTEFNKIINKKGRR